MYLQVCEALYGPDRSVEFVVGVSAEEKQSVDMRWIMPPSKAEPVLTLRRSVSLMNVNVETLLQLLDELTAADKGSADVQ